MTRLLPRVAFLALALALDLTLTACPDARRGETRSVPEEPDEEIYEYIQVYSSPADGWTAHREVPRVAVELAIPGGGIYTDDYDHEVIAEHLSSVLSLVEWPSLKPVSATISVVPPQILSSEYVTSMDLLLTPASELAEDRWYAMRLSSVPVVPSPGMPEDVRLQADLGWKLLDGGIRVARFTPGSSPRITSVDVCHAQDGSELIVWFSELVVSSGKIEDAFEIRSGGAALDCVADYSLGDENFGGTASLECPRLAQSAITEVELLAGRISAPAGAAAAPTTVRFVLDDLERDEEGCWSALGP